MKKSKLVLATLAAAVFATSAAGLAACSKSTGGGDDNFTVTFDANGSYFGTDATATTMEVETIDGLALQPTPAARSDGYTFNGYTFTKDGTDTVASTNIFTDSVTVYASWTSTGGGGGGSQGVYSITLDANGGQLGAVTSLQTSNGKLAALPTAPTAPTEPAGQTFVGWFDAATGGTQITTDTVFTGPKTIYAQWTGGSGGGGGTGGGGTGGGGTGGGGTGGGGGQTVTATGNDVYVGATVKYNLSDNASNINTTLYPTQDAEWMLMGEDFAAGDVISVKINSEDITLSDVQGFGASAWDSSTITIKNTASFNMYVKHWSDSGHWTVWITDGSADAIPSQGGGGQTQTSGYKVNGGAAQALVENTQTDTSDGRDKEYFITGNGKVTLTQGDTITFVIDGQPVSAYIFGSSNGVDKTDLDNPQSQFTITTTGEFQLMLRHYPASQGNPTGSWTAEFAGPVNIGTGGSIPQGAVKCDVNFGSQKITLYMKKDGQAVTSLTGYKLYCWNGGTKLFGEWPGTQMVDGMSTSLGTLNSSTGVIVNWSGGQTANISGLELGHTYVITLINQDFEISMVS